MLRTWLLVGSLFVGAVVALAATLFFGGDEGPGGGGAGTSKESDEVRATFHSPPGSCLTWDAADAADARKVDCAQPHLFEVSGVVNISDKYPVGAPTPDLPAWRTLAQERCRDGANAYLGKERDPYGKLDLGVLRPTEEQWSDGDREIRCGLQWPGPGGGLQKLSTPAAQLNQSNVWEPGTCLGLNGKAVSDPVECLRPHAYEIIATVDLNEKFPDEYPSPDEQAQFLDTECTRLVGEYTGGKDLEKDKLILAWDRREEPSWNAGSRLVNCKVGSPLPDSSGLAAVTNSVKAG